MVLPIHNEDLKLSNVAMTMYLLHFVAGYVFAISEARSDALYLF